MIVEISGRQTGKTTRMIEHMAHKIIYGASSITLLCWSVVQYRHIIGRLEDKLVELGGEGWEDSRDYLEQIIKRGHDMYDDNTFYYLDEFDGLDVFSDGLTIRDNAYYCTSIVHNMPFTNSLMRYCRSNGIEIQHAPSNQNVLRMYEEWGEGGMNEMRTMSQFYDRYDLFVNIGNWFKKDFIHKRRLKKFEWKKL